MNAEELLTFAHEVGDCVLRAKYLAETNRKDEAKKLRFTFSELRASALENNIKVDFFEKRSYMRRAHPDFPEMRTRTSCEIPMPGGWTVAEDIMRFHLRISVELIFDGNAAGGPQPIPGSVDVKVVPGYDLEPMDDPDLDVEFERIMKRMYGLSV